MPDGASFKKKETIFKLILGIVNLLKFSSFKKLTPCLFEVFNFQRI